MSRNRSMVHLLVTLTCLAAGCVTTPTAEDQALDLGAADGFGGGEAEGDAGFSREGSLAESLDSVLLPEYRAARSQWFEGVSGVTLNSLWLPPLDGQEEVAALVVLSGRTESHCKYLEVLHDLQPLRAAGVSIHIMDHRGQGFSDRMLEDPEMGFVDDFQDYVDDVGIFIDTVVRQNDPDLPVLGLAHSMGGAILAMYAIQNPETFDAIVLASPMLEIDFGEDFTEDSAYWAAWAAPNWIYAVGQGPYAPGAPFEDNELTHSRARYELTQRIFEVEFPMTRLGGPTFGWIVESIEADRWIRDHAAELQTPTLLLQALEDTVVVEDAQTAFCAQAPSCALLPFPGAHHELLMETDDIRDQALSSALTFIRAHLP